MLVHKKSSIVNSILSLWVHLEARRKQQFVLLMALSLAGALAEVISLASVLPFLSILTEPAKVLNYPFIKHIAFFFDITSHQQLQLLVTILFIAISLLSGGVRLLLLWSNTRFACAVGSDLSIDVYRKTLHQPYEAQISRNSSLIVSGIVNQVNGVVFWIVLPLLTLFSSIVLLGALSVTLFLIDPFVSTIAFIGFLSCYALLYKISRQRLRLNGESITHEEAQVIKALQEGLGAIRDILLDGTQEIFCKTYRQADRSLRRAYGSNIFIGGGPRFVMEAIGMALIASLAYTLSLQSEGILAALPVLGALALGAQRLLPALQQSYNAWTTIAGGHASLAAIVVHLEQSMPNEKFAPIFPPLSFSESIQFDEVSFRYSIDGPWVLRNFNLKIAKGFRLGIIGNTGSGKSTAIDLLMGLLSPTEGSILVDGQPLTGNRKNDWQKKIAHVPQSIYLTDSSLAENIAFGIPKNDIDMIRVREAAKQAQISDFIESRPGGYEAKVGERGIQLSGGQRQRIGIARALYKQAQVLVFDEATSALDNQTEVSVMEAIDGLASNLTIVLIAHRLTTLSRCDTIVQIEDGSVSKVGTYAQLMGANSTF
jgi:ABC-type multidrug transport system fused ATPase/permease subunit